MDTQRGAATQSKQQLQAHDLISAAVSYIIASPSSASFHASMKNELLPASFWGCDVTNHGRDNS